MSLNRLKNRFLILSLACACAWLLLLLSVFVWRNFVWDDHVVLFLFYKRMPPHWLQLLCKGFSTLANTETVSLLLVLTGVWVYKTRKFRPEFLFLLVEGLACAGINALLKCTIGHELPKDDPLAYKGLFYSFPSGHTMLAVAFYGLLFYMLSVYYPRYKGLCLGLGLLTGVAIGASRVVLGVHYFSDVLGGYLIAIPLLLAGIYFYRVLAVNPTLRLYASTEDRPLT